MVHLNIPLTYYDMSLSRPGKELLIVRNALQIAISAVAYVPFTGSDGRQSLGILTGKAKFAL